MNSRSWKDALRWCGDHRRLVQGGALAALSMTGLSIGLSIAGSPDPAASAPWPPPASQVAVTRPVDEAAIKRLRSFALNAFLVTLIDDHEPPHWTDVALHYFCGPETRVEVDGKPMVPGAPVPATAFTVRWTMDQCWPLDADAFDASGVVELLVFHEDTGLSAIVDAGQLQIRGTKGSYLPSAPFPASMSLATMEALH